MPRRTLAAGFAASLFLSAHAIASAQAGRVAAVEKVIAEKGLLQWYGRIK